MYNLTIPEWEERNGDFHGERHLVVDLVDNLYANVEPSHDLVFKYYGIPPKSAFKAIEVDRLIFWSEDSGYIIVPNVAANRKLWRKID
jgi:hypothetical protein